MCVFRYSLLLISLLFPSLLVANVIVSDGFVREKPPVSENTAAYMTFKNQGKQSVQLVKVESKAAKRVEIHTHEHVNGVMRMRQIPSLEIKAGESKTLKPGGLHLMMMGFVPPANNLIDLKLTFSDQQVLELQLPLQAN